MSISPVVAKRMGQHFQRCHHVQAKCSRRFYGKTRQVVCHLAISREYQVDHLIEADGICCSEESDSAKNVLCDPLEEDVDSVGHLSKQLEVDLSVLKQCIVRLSCHSLEVEVDSPGRKDISSSANQSINHGQASPSGARSGSEDISLVFRLAGGATSTCVTRLFTISPHPLSIPNRLCYTTLLRQHSSRHG